jgi:hypothetical protein
MTSAAQFNAEVKAWFDTNVVKKPLEAQRTAILEALTSAVQATAVGNEDNWKINAERARRGLPPYKRPNYVGGRARGNWQINFGSPLRDQLNVIDPTGVKTIQRGIAVARGIQQLGITYLTNNVPYIGVIDQGKPGTQPLYRPWSKQSPEGILKPLIDGVLRRLRTIR